MSETITVYTIFDGTVKSVEAPLGGVVAIDSLFCRNKNRMFFKTEKVAKDCLRIIKNRKVNYIIHGYEVPIIDVYINGDLQYITLPEFRGILGYPPIDTITLEKEIFVERIHAAGMNILNTSSEYESQANRDLLAQHLDTINTELSRKITDWTKVLESFRYIYSQDYLDSKWCYCEVIDVYHNGHIKLLDEKTIRDLKKKKEKDNKENVKKYVAR